MQEAGILREKGYEDHDAYSRIVLGGLSQGCAAAIFSLLGGGWGENGRETLGAFCGMSGWLPFQGQLSEILNFRVENDRESLDGLDEGMGQLDIEFSGGSDEEEEDEDADVHEEDDDHNDIESNDDDTEDSNSSNANPQERYDDNEGQVSFDPFGEDSDDSDPVTSTEEVSRTISAINHLRDILDLPPLLNAGGEDKITTPADVSHLRTPVFLGHGAADPKVSVRLGEEMVRLLAGPLDMDVTWKRYEGFGHWYKVPDEIDDLVDFLHTKVGVPVNT